MLFFAHKAEAHDPNHSYIFLKIYEQRIIGRLEITAKDLNRELGLELNKEVVESEVMQVEAQIHAYLLS